MKKNKRTVVLSSFLILALSFNSVSVKADQLKTPNEKDDCIEVYVSTSGNDNNSGSENKPLRTLDGARKKVRTLKKGIKPVTVVFEEGEYFFDDTVVFDRADSGSKNAPVTYRAKEGKKVIFTGAKEIDTKNAKKVSDPEIISRLPQSARNNVYEINLKESGIKKDLIDYTKVQDNPVNAGTNMPVLQFFLNDKLQQVARWPNSGYITAGTVSGGSSIRSGASADKATDGAYIYFDGQEPTRWINAENAFINGFLGNEYHGESAKIGFVDTQNMRIKLNAWAMYGVSTGAKWYAFNLLEEIDVPGEWYVDRDNMILYYYPQDDLKNSKLELAVLDKNFIDMNGTKYVTFKDIEFAKNAAGSSVRVESDAPLYGGNGILLNKTKGISLINCIVRDIGMSGIYFDAEDTLIDGCVLYNTGICGIVAGGGNRYYLRSGNNIITNCHISETMRDSHNNSYAGIKVLEESAGLRITHNLIHNIANSAIFFRGIENVIEYNEIYNCVLETADAGAIYTGRSWADFGADINHNYFHDIGMKEDTNYFCASLYLDDYHSGTKFTDNIINTNNMKNVNSAGVLINRGSNNVIKNNTIINSGLDFWGAKQIMGKNDSSGLLCMQRLDALPYTDPLYVSKYPELKELAENFKKRGVFLPSNTVTDNFSVNCNETKFVDDIMIKYGNIKDNEKFDGAFMSECFVAPEKQDYRIKNEVKEKYGYRGGPDESFDIEQISVNNYKLDSDRMSFDMLYPLDNETDVQVTGLMLSWQKATFADSYIYKISTDPDMNEIIASGETPYNAVSVENIDYNTTYYWTVEALNKSRQVPLKVTSSSGKRSFKTAEYDIVNTRFLNEKIDAAREKMKSIKESDIIGEYAKGSIEQYRKIISECEVYSKIEKGRQSEIDKMYKKLNDFMIYDDSLKNTGEMSLPFTKDSEWYSTVPLKSIEKDDEKVSITAEQRVNVVLCDKLSNSGIYKFKVSVNNFLDGNWFSIGIKQQDRTKMQYSDDSYYVAIKKDIFELQKKGKIIKTKENNGIFVEGKEYNITVSALTVSDGVKITYELDGNVLFSYTDKDNPQLSDGMLAFNMFPGLNITVRK